MMLTSEQGPDKHEKVNPTAIWKKTQGRASAKALEKELCPFGCNGVSKGERERHS